MESEWNSSGPAVLGEETGQITASPVEAGPHGAIRTRLYREGKLIKEDFPPEEISEELRQRHGCIIWLDLCEPTIEQLDIIGREFGLHELAIEDALELIQVLGEVNIQIEDGPFAAIVRHNGGG